MIGRLYKESVYVIQVKNKYSSGPKSFIGRICVFPSSACWDEASGDGIICRRIRFFESSEPNEIVYNINKKGELLRQIVQQL